MLFPNIDCPLISVTITPFQKKKKGKHFHLGLGYTFVSGCGSKECFMYDQSAGSKTITGKNFKLVIFKQKLWITTVDQT